MSDFSVNLKNYLQIYSDKYLLIEIEIFFVFSWLKKNQTSNIIGINESRQKNLHSQHLNWGFHMRYQGAVYFFARVPILVFS